jgi:hypothetical protein
MSAGINGKAKAKKGSWITLSEWINDGIRWIPVSVKTEQVDGIVIKEDTYYSIKDGKFIEVSE